MSERPPDDWIRYSVWTHQCDRPEWPADTQYECRDIRLTGGVSWAAASFMAVSQDRWQIPRQRFEIHKKSELVWSNKFIPQCKRKEPHA